MSFDFPMPTHLRPAKPDTADLDYNLSDAGNAQIFALLYGDQFRHDARTAEWRAWKGHYWGPPDDGELVRMAIEAARARGRWATTLPASTKEEREFRDKVSRHAMNSENKGKVESMLWTAENYEPFVVADHLWDADPWLLGCANGVLDLRDGSLREGRQEDYVTHHSPVAYNPDAQCPLWLKFLHDIFDDNNEMVRFVQRAAGYSMSGDAREQVLFLCFGGGSNGKSTFLNILREVLGSYAANMAFQSLERKDRGGGSGPTPDMAALPGKRLVTSSETNEGTQMNEGRVKSLTGNDPITARVPYATREFTFQPVLKLWLAVNHLPVVKDDSEGFWRRIRTLPFRVQFSGARMDRQLDKKLRREYPGILAWLVQGCLEWQSEGLAPPQDVMLATLDYRERQDVVAAFQSDRCVLHPNAQAPAGQLFTKYKEWSEREGYAKPLSNNEFADRVMRIDGVDRKHTNNGRVYTGIGLKALGEESEGSEGLRANSPEKGNSHRDLSDQPSGLHFESSGEGLAFTSEARTCDCWAHEGDETGCDGVRLVKNMAGETHCPGCCQLMATNNGEG